MTDRLKPLSLLLALAALLVIGASAAPATDHARASAVEEPPPCVVICEPPCSGTCEPPPCFGPCEPPIEVENPDPKHSILVLNVGWESNPETSSPLVKSDLDLFVNYLGGHLNDWFRKSAPGIFQNWQVAPGGSYMIPAPHRLSCLDDAGLQNEVDQSAEAAARATGVNPDLYTLVVVHWRFLCGFDGLAQGTGQRHIALMHTISALHEFGHYLGLHHSNSSRCFAKQVQVALSEDCEQFEYGDEYDVMGQGSGAYDAVNANALGWLNNQFVSVTPADPTRSYTLKPYAESATGLRALRLVDGKATLWLEYRQPVGIDAPGYSENFRATTPGLLVHRELPTSGGLPSSLLLDMTPGETPLNPVFPVGQTWANPLGTTRITLNSANASGATVTIETPRVSVPNLSGTLANAKAAIQAAGLTFGGSESVKDETCTLVNQVVSQNPPAGTTVLRGSSVRVSIGVKDPEHECQ